MVSMFVATLHITHDRRRRRRRRRRSSSARYSFYLKISLRSFIFTIGVVVVDDISKKKNKNEQK